MSYHRRMTEAGGNPTPHQAVRVPDRMWKAFGRVCKRRGTSRNARIMEMIRSDIRRHGDDQDKADLQGADAELKERRSRKGIRHSRQAHPSAGKEPQVPVTEES